MATPNRIIDTHVGPVPVASGLSTHVSIYFFLIHGGIKFVKKEQTYHI